LLESIRGLVEDDETAASSRLPTLNELLFRCRAELETLNTTLEKNVGRDGRTQALVWPLKESEVHKALDKLGKLQDLLTTAMDVDQTYVAPATFESMLIIRQTLDPEDR
jgi:hypothetical protein